jgi:carbonic anhydrase
MFDVRVAGNVAGNDELASIEYAAEHFHLPLIVVMGHQKCGAVDAAVKGGELHGHLPGLIAAIRPAVDRTKNMPGDKVENAVRANVENVVAQLRTDAPVLSERVAKGNLKIVGAVYSLDTGKVEWLPAAAAR